MERPQTGQDCCLKNPEAVKMDRLYRDVFLGAPGAAVLEDLKKFCLYDDDLKGKDALETYRNLGRRDVLIRILKRIKSHERAD